MIGVNAQFRNQKGNASSQHCCLPVPGPATTLMALLFLSSNANFVSGSIGSMESQPALHSYCSCAFCRRLFRKKGYFHAHEFFLQLKTQFFRFSRISTISDCVFNLWHVGHNACKFWFPLWPPNATGII